MLSFLKKKKQVLEVVWDTPHSQKQKLVDEAYHRFLQVLVLTKKAKKVDTELIN